jgi:hypothetical protein
MRLPMGTAHEPADQATQRQRRQYWTYPLDQQATGCAQQIDSLR